MLLERHGVLAAITVFAFAMVAMSCENDASVAPRAIGRSPTHPSFNQGIVSDTDSCTTGGTFPSCHDDNILDVNPDDSTLCPGGCHTFLPTNAQKSELQLAIDTIPNNAECGFAISYIGQMLLHGRVRIYYPDDGANADTHPTKAWGSDGLPDMGAAIHVWNQRADYGSARQLGNTLVHEAFHGYYNNGDDVQAQKVADDCLPGGFP